MTSIIFLQEKVTSDDKRFKENLTPKITTIEQNLSRLEEKLEGKNEEISREKDKLKNANQIPEVAGLPDNVHTIQADLQKLKEEKQDKTVTEKEDIANLSSWIRADETSQRQMILYRKTLR